MYTRSDYSRSIGQWAQFRTPWGMHRGIISDVNNQAVLVRVPRQYVPTGLMSYTGSDDEKKLDVALAGYGALGGGYGAGYGPYAGRWGYPGYGAWGGGWWWWWLAFAWIFALAFLW